MRTWTHPAHIVLGLTVWALWFVAIYSVLSVGCVFWPPGVEDGPLTWINAAVLGLTALVGGWLFWAGWRCRAQHQGMDEALPHRRFVVAAAAVLYFFSAFIVLGVGLPVILYPPCL